METIHYGRHGIFLALVGPLQQIYHAVPLSDCLYKLFVFKYSFLSLLQHLIDVLKFVTQLNLSIDQWSVEDSDIFQGIHIVYLLQLNRT